MTNSLTTFLKVIFTLFAALLASFYLSLYAPLKDDSFVLNNSRYRRSSSRTFATAACCLALDIFYASHGFFLTDRNQSLISSRRSLRHTANVGLLPSYRQSIIKNPHQALLHQSFFSFFPTICTHTPWASTQLKHRFTSITKKLLVNACLLKILQAIR